MSTTLESASSLTSLAKGQVERGSARLVQLFSFVPDEKLTWSATPESRSPLRLIVHCALCNTFFANGITGNGPTVQPSPEEFFRDLHASELEPATRADALARLEATTAELLRAIESVDDARFAEASASPFGPLPVSFWIEQGGEHLAYHGAQLAFLQTLWGDIDNHMG